MYSHFFYCTKNNIHIVYFYLFFITLLYIEMNDEERKVKKINQSLLTCLSVNDLKRGERIVLRTFSSSLLLGLEDLTCSLNMSTIPAIRSK